MKVENTVVFRRPVEEVAGLLPGAPIPEDGAYFKHVDLSELLHTYELEEAYWPRGRLDRDERNESSNYRFRRRGAWAILTVYTKPHGSLKESRRGLKTKRRHKILTAT